jgi:hypothetical protein
MAKDIQGYDVNPGDYVLHDMDESLDNKTKGYVVSRVLESHKTTVVVNYQHDRWGSVNKPTTVRKFFKVTEEVFKNFENSPLWKKMSEAERVYWNYEHTRQFPNWVSWRPFP